MSRYQIPLAPSNRREDMPAGSWRLVMWGDDRSFIISCPKCGLEACANHSIEPNGDVNPSVVCPHDGCDFHEFVTLEGWADA